jgi:teichuronic acid biosynthesis glycosyltransferase TuaG
MRIFEDGLVSVITPVYKVEKHIFECIQSVLDQTFDNIEIVLVDDCSPDHSVDIIKKMMRAHPNIRYEKLEKNSGAAVARNRALEIANGRYVAFLDSDDKWLPDKIEKQIRLIKSIDTPLVFGAINMIDEEGNEVKTSRYIPSKISYRGLLRNTAIATSTVLIDREKAGDFRMPLIRSGQDYATWLSILRGGETAYSITDQVSCYRKTEGSLSSKKTENWKKVWNIQVNQEGISNVAAYFNCFCYAVHAVFKYLF